VFLTLENSLFYKSTNSRNIEIVISQSLVLPHTSFSLFKSASSQDYQGAIIIKGLTVPDFLIIPKEFGDTWFVDNAQEFKDALPLYFTEKYHILSKPEDVLSIPNAFFDYVTYRQSLLILESKNNSLAIFKVGESVNNDGAITTMLTRSEIVLDLLCKDSELSQASTIFGNC